MEEAYRKRFQELGLKIAYYRKKKGLTQEEFAEAVGISWSFVSQIEANNGRRLRGVSLTTLYKMADFFEIPAARLLEEDDRAGGSKL